MRASWLLLSLLACGDPGQVGDPGPDTATGDTAAEGTEDCTHEVIYTWESGIDGLFRGRCTSCHSSTTADRWGAPEYLNYDTLEGVIEAQHAIRQAALCDQVMPPGYPLVAEEQEMLSSFLDCGIPK